MSALSVRLPHAIQFGTAEALGFSWERHDRIVRRVVVGEGFQRPDALEEHLIVRLGNVLCRPAGFEVIEFIGHTLAGEE